MEATEYRAGVYKVLQIELATPTQKLTNQIKQGKGMPKEWTQGTIEHIQKGT